MAAKNPTLTAQRKKQEKPMALEDTVTDLIAHCRAGEDGYRRASEILLEEPELVHYFDEQAQTRAIAARALEDRFSKTGKRLRTESLIAPPAEGWSWPTTQDSTTEAVIASCHRGEERAVRAYQQALGALPDEWRWEVSVQYQSMRSTLAKLRAWLQDKETRPQRS
jgi:uncharacterized protein (TIGR02284 family)